MTAAPPPPAPDLHRTSTGSTGGSLGHHQLTENATGQGGGPPAGVAGTGWDPPPPPPAGARQMAGPFTGLGVLTVVLVVVCAGIALLTGWSEFMAAAVAGVVLLAVSALFLIGRSSYTVGVNLHSARVVAGQRATGALTVRNAGSRRVLPARMELPVGASTASFRIPGLAAGADHEELFVIPTGRRAVIPVGPATSVRGDAFGLMRRQVRWTEVENLFVHPRTVTLHGASTGAMRDLEGQPTRDLSSNDVSFHALRQYVPGDDRRYVHWRTSARTGRLMVRQFEETRRTHLAVALSIDPGEYHSVAEFELAISAAASLSAQALREERPVTVCAGSAPLLGGSGRKLLDGFSAIEPVPGSGVVPAGRQAAAAVPNASVAILLTGRTPDAMTIRRAGTAFSVGIRALAVRVEAGAGLRLGAIGQLDVVTVGSLDDLPRALRRMRAA